MEKKIPNPQQSASVLLVELTACATVPCAHCTAGLGAGGAALHTYGIHSLLLTGSQQTGHKWRRLRSESKGSSRAGIQLKAEKGGSKALKAKHLWSLPELAKLQPSSQSSAHGHWQLAPTPVCSHSSAPPAPFPPSC